MGTVVLTRVAKIQPVVWELELEPVAGLVAAEEGGLFVLVEAGDDGEVGAGAGADVGASTMTVTAGPVIWGGSGVDWGEAAAVVVAVRRTVTVLRGSWACWLRR